MFSKQDSFKKGIVLSTTLNIGAKAISFVNALLLVYMFGTNYGTDSYFLVISTIGFIASFIIGIVNYVMIPEAMRIKQARGYEAEQSYVNFFIWLYIAIGAIFALFIYFFPFYFYSLFSRYSVNDISQYRVLFLISSVLFPLTFLVNLFVLVLASHRRFTVPMAVALINSIISIFLLIFLGRRYGINVAIIAYAAGFLINFLWLVYYYKRVLRWNFFRISFPTKKNWHNIFFIEINLLPVTLRSYTIIYLLTGLGAGVITSYNYGMQIALIPELMVVSQISSVLGIKYNELSATFNLEAINRLFNHAMRLLFFVLFPLGCLMFLLSDEMLEVIFMFKKKDAVFSVDNMAAFVACFAVTLPFRAFDSMISLIVTAQQKIKEGVIFAFILHTSAIVITILSLNFYGVRGFLFGTVFIYGVLMPVFYFFFVRRVLPFLDINKWMRHTFVYVLAISAITVLLHYLKPVVFGNSGTLVIIVSLSIVFIVLTYCINFFLKYADYSLRLKE
jgi:putative peptidoglycan lipid II flippase